MAAAPKSKKKPERSSWLDRLTIGSRLSFLGQYWRRLQRLRPRTLLKIGAIVIGVVIGLQLLYPYDRAVPTANIKGKNVALASHNQMAKAITDQFDDSKVKLVLGSRTKEVSVKLMGGEPDTEEMIKTLSHYPIWQRLIPGSILWPTHSLGTLDTFYSDKPFSEFAEAGAKEFSFAPQNARLEIKEGQVVASEAVPGSEVKPGELKQAISRAILQLGQSTTVGVPSKKLPAQRTSKDLAPVQQQAEAALGHDIKISVGGQTFSPDKTTLASWIVLSTDDRGNVALSIDRAKIKTYLDEVNKKVGAPAGQTNIEIVDGIEIRRTIGATGRTIDSDPVVEQIATGILAAPKQVEVTAPLRDLPPSVIFNSQYTATQAGLQAFINDTARTKNMYISIQQLTGNGWSVGARANESIPSGSTYKLFVSLVLFDKIDKGEIRWEDPMLDTTVAGCFDRMTVASTNPCAEKWIAEFGRQYINDFVHARGFSSGTSFTTGSANQSTAADLTKYMIGLNNGSLVGGAHRDRLLNNLGRHPYRYGIPTGSGGSVNDKVGFLWDYIHDTAIVHHPRGTYVMTIMTKGQSYAAIAAVTRSVEKIMYP